MSGAEPIWEKGLQAVCDLGAQRHFCSLLQGPQRSVEDFLDQVVSEECRVLPAPSARETAVQCGPSSAVSQPSGVPQASLHEQLAPPLTMIVCHTWFKGCLIVNFTIQKFDLTSP